MYLFCSREISPLVSHLRKLLVSSSVKTSTIRVTGGGAYKYASLFHEELNIHIEKVDEMHALIAGLDFVLRLPDSCFSFDLVSSSTTVPFQIMCMSPSSSSPQEASSNNSVYPLLLVNIGSGVSILKISDKNTYQRVGGSAIGGGTALGLGKLLIGCDSFDELISLSKYGNSSNVDLSAGQLLGPNLASLLLHSSDSLAASLGNLQFSEISKHNREDIAQSIIKMISYNIGYVSLLVARTHKIPRIFFSGKYVYKHEPTMEAISYAVQFYQNTFCGAQEVEEKIEAKFLVHEGYLGAVGALLS